MITSSLDLPTLPLFIVLILFYGITAAAIHWVGICSPLPRQIRTLTGVVAPFFGAVSILFALLSPSGFRYKARGAMTGGPWAPGRLTPGPRRGTLVALAFRSRP